MIAHAFSTPLPVVLDMDAIEAAAWADTAVELLSVLRGVDPSGGFVDPTRG